jgi:NTE family protein
MNPIARRIHPATRVDAKAESGVAQLASAAVGAAAAKRRRVPDRPPFECIALLLQGGGALGSYQAGVYAALAEAELQPDWVAGISIGAINGALIAGNAPERRVERSGHSGAVRPPFGLDGWLAPLEASDIMRGWMNQSGAAIACSGRAWILHAASDGTVVHSADGASATATTKQQSCARRRTLVVSTGSTRASTVSAVNVPFEQSGLLHPGARIGPGTSWRAGAAARLSAVEIDGEHYWDGGLVSNTPLDWVVENVPRQDTLAFQVDLWSARGDFPRDMAEVETRRKEIVYSSRTRASTSSFKRMQRMRNAAAKLSADMPEHVRKAMSAAADDQHKAYNIVTHLSREDLRPRRLRVLAPGMENIGAATTMPYAPAPPRVLRRSRPDASSPSTCTATAANKRGHHDRRRVGGARACACEPGLPSGPYRLSIANILIITYRTDPEQLRAIVLSHWRSARLW